MFVTFEKNNRESNMISNYVLANLAFELGHKSVISCLEISFDNLRRRRVDCVVWAISTSEGRNIIRDKDGFKWC